MLDKLETFRTWLLEPSALIDALGGNYIAVNRMAPGFENTHAAILLMQETGGAHVSGGEVNDVVICRCYGGSDKDSDARAIFRALYDRCKNNVPAPPIKEIFYESDFFGGDEPVTGWPSHVGRFAVYMEN